MRHERWRSVLFVPGDRPDRIAKAAGAGADAIVIDLEDAVAPPAKDRARAAAVDQLQHGLAGSTMIRVNADADELADDVEAIGPVLDRVEAVLLPKTSGPDDVAGLEELLDSVLAGSTRPSLIPIIETAAGVFEARAIGAASPRVATLMFGPADLSAELGIEPTPAGHELSHARSQVVLAAAAGGLAAPLDGPHLVLDDADGLAVATRTAWALGFGGKAVIHPQQIPAVHAGFTAHAEQVAWAQRVLAAVAAGGEGAARLADGTFVDEPIARRARAILEMRAGDDSRPAATGGSR